MGRRFVAAVRTLARCLVFRCQSLQGSTAVAYVFSLVVARATERGLSAFAARQSAASARRRQSAGVLVSEGPVLRSSTAETERSLRSRFAAFCRGASSHTAEGRGFGILPSVTCSRSCGINPAPRRDSGWGAKPRSFQHCYHLPRRSMLGFGREKPRAHLDTTTGTQPSGRRGVSFAPCCSVNAAFLFAEPRILVVVSRCAQKRKQTENENKMQRTFDPCRWQLGSG